MRRGVELAGRIAPSQASHLTARWLLPASSRRPPSRNFHWLFGFIDISMSCPPPRNSVRSDGDANPRALHLLPGPLIAFVNAIACFPALIRPNMPHGPARPNRQMSGSTRHWPPGVSLPFVDLTYPVPMPWGAVRSHGNAHCRTRYLLPVIAAPSVQPISRVKCLHRAHMPHGPICSDGNVSGYAWHLTPGLPFSSTDLSIEVPTPGFACWPYSDSDGGPLHRFPITVFPSINSQASASAAGTNLPH